MNMSAIEIWNKDTLKNLWMSERGYQVLTIWESEYKKNPKQTLEKCIKFINE
jgi:very-short-patch-repair endonuclease